MKKPTIQEIDLLEALRKRGVDCVSGKSDSYKSIDISIPSAKIDIEIDGLHHYTNPRQLKSDFYRSYWSLKRDGYDTIHIPNMAIDNYLEKVADAIAQVAKEAIDEKIKCKNFFYATKKIFRISKREIKHMIFKKGRNN
jgi:very-short-patch-repair endonuclease